MANIVKDMKLFRRVEMAGTESSEICCGYISGAVYSGKRAANKVWHKTLIKQPHCSELLIFLLMMLGKRRVAATEACTGYLIVSSVTLFTSILILRLN